MANFKGGFAFNNEAAKVEVEQAPDGTLISCVNPVTGESLGGGGGGVLFEHNVKLTNAAGSPKQFCYLAYQAGDAPMMFVYGSSLGANASMTWANCALVDGKISVYGIVSTAIKITAVSNCTIEEVSITGGTNVATFIIPTDPNSNVEVKAVTR